MPTTPYQAKSFEQLIGTPGFSDALLKTHFTLYQGYVSNVNKLLDKLEHLVLEGKADTPEYAELNRRFGWEFNGMRLHEYYFENMSQRRIPTLDRESDLFKELQRNFGSYENWEKDFKGIGAMRGIGWAVLYFDPAGRKLMNVWIDEHDTGHLAGCAPVLVMDVFEHAFLIDYGTKRADYIKAFFNAADWRIAAERFRQAEAALRQAV